MYINASQIYRTEWFYCLPLSQLQAINIKTCTKYQADHIGGYISIHPAFLSNYAFYLQTQCPSLIAPYQLKGDLNINVF